MTGVRTHTTGSGRQITKPEHTGKCAEKMRRDVGGKRVGERIVDRTAQSRTR